MLPADAVSHRNRRKQSMDPPQDTSELTAAPRDAPMADDAPTVSSAHAVAFVSEAADYQHGMSEIMPPRPLPPIAFRSYPEPSPDMTPPAPMPARVFLRSGPAFEAAAEPPAEAEQASEPEEAAVQHFPVDSVFSEIDAEAAARSLTAIEAKAPASAAPPNLGSLIPGAPRLEMPSRRPAPAFSGLQPDFAVRPDFGGSGTSFPAAGGADYRSLGRRFIRIVAWVVAGWLALVLLLMVAYRFVNPPLSSLMLQQWLFGEKIVNVWVPIEKISPNIVRAVVASEDDRFCEHNGVDFGALKDVVTDAGNGATRGASTISMQVVKNLFLWPSRSYVRKAVEMPLTFVMELIWPKRRIMEVYLNIAEWGPGIFGIEAASRYYFGTSANNLSAGQASRLAVALPNPRVRNPAKPGPGMKRLARVVQMRTRMAPASRTACVLPRRRN
jgi:monofunctional biosynthetic peptidoglycan transglycosylase